MNAIKWQLVVYTVAKVFLKIMLLIVPLIKKFSFLVNLEHFTNYVMVKHYLNASFPFSFTQIVCKSLDSS